MDENDTNTRDENMSQLVANAMVANTILEQLGGNRFRAMTGAMNFLSGTDSNSSSDPYVLFALPPCQNGINRVRITLTPTDTYTVQFFKVRGHKYRTISVHEDIYADMLRNVFEQATGLRTSL